MDIALDETTGDILVENGDLKIISGSFEAAQLLRSKMKMFLAEWFLDESKGLPFFDMIFVKNPNMTVIDAIFKSEILNSPGIVELIEYSTELNPSLRIFYLRFKARSVDGEIIEFEEAMNGG